MTRLLSATLLLVTFAIVGCQEEGALNTDLFCGPAFPKFLSVGTSIEMRAILDQGLENLSGLQVVWSRLFHNGSLEVMATCTLQNCNSSLASGTATLKITDEGNPTVFTSTFTIDFVKAENGGAWLVTWFKGQLNILKLESCVVIVRPNSPSLNCPTSFIGYPLKLTALSRSFSPDILDMKFFKGIGNNTLWANCSSSDCRLSNGNHTASIGTSTVTHGMLWQSDLTIVADESSIDYWTAIWYLKESRIESATCFVSLENNDPKSDCLEPIVTQPPKWQLNELVLVTLKCFTRKIETIVLAGNYSAVLEDTKHYLSFTKTAQFKFKIVHELNFPTTLEIDFDISFVQGSSIRRSVRLHLESSLQASEFSQSFYSFSMSEDISAGISFHLGRDLIPSNYSLQVTKSFPIPFEPTFELSKIEPGLHMIQLKQQQRILALESLFEFEYLFKLTHFESGRISHFMVILYQQDKYPLTCAREVSIELYSNASEITLVPLPCTVYDVRHLMVSILKFPEYLQVKQDSSNLRFEIGTPLPSGIVRDFMNVSVFGDTRMSKIFVPSIEFNFKIKQIPPTPVFLKAETTLYSADIYIQVAPTVEILSELLTKEVILSFFLEIHIIDGTTITSQKLANISGVPGDDGQIVYQINGLHISTEYTGRVIALGTDANVTSEYFTFKTQSGPPTPVLQRIETTLNSAKMYIKVASTIRRMTELMTDGVIKFFLLSVQYKEAVITLLKYVTISELPEDEGIIIYDVRELEPLSKYTGEFIIVGAGINTTTGNFGFQTMKKLEIPFVHSSQPNIVALDDKLYLNCSSNVTGIHFKWYHEGVLLKEENENQLKLVARNNTAGIYQCQIIDKKNSSSKSGEYLLTVLRPEDINELTTVNQITFQKEWNPTLEYSSSPQFFIMKVYVENLIKLAMYRRPNFVRSQVISFSQGSIIANTEIVERVINPDESTNVLSYLQTQLDSGIADSFVLNVINLQLSGIDLITADPNVIQEGSAMEINCQFVIVHSIKPIFDMVWIYNHSIINQERATTFTFEHKLSILSKQDGWLDLGSTNVYHYNYKLKIQHFPPRLIGTFSCKIELKMPDIPPDIIDMDKTQSLNITYNQIWRQPKVLIHPPSFQVQDPSVNISVSCNYSYAETVYLLNDMDKVIGRVMTDQTWRGTVQFQISPFEKNVRCLAKSLETLQTESARCNIHIIKTEFVYCETDEDTKGLLWEKWVAGTTSVMYCPKGYSGTVTRKCLESGKWEESSYINCTKEVLETVNEEIKNINDDGFVVTNEQIKDISQTVNSSILGPAPILSGDIVQVVDILNEVGKAVAVEGKEKPGDLVDSETLENFVNAADAVLSTDDSQWDTIKKAEVEGTGNEETSGVGSKLVVAMDLLASASLSINATVSTQPIVKKSVVIKRDKITQEDIVFPRQNEEGYDKFDGWVVESETKAFLSGQNFVDLQGQEVQYAIVLFRGVDSKFVVENDEQKKYSSSKGLKDKEIASDIMSFSLSKGISSFTYPLKMEFQITKENHTRPVCGFLDTSLGSQPVWSSKGCKTDQIMPDIVECQCNHLTNFAILMSPYGTSEDHHEILSIVTYAGCGVSILCLLITIVMHAITWKYLKEDRTVLHVHLSVILILAYVAFLAGINQTDHALRCTIIAALLHFLFLTVFFIMLAEGIQILITVNFVFSKESHIWKLLIMAYVCPMVVVAVCLGVTKTDGYTSSDFCWLDVDSGFLWGFVGPALFVIMVNFIIMIMTLKAMMTTVSMQAKTRIARAKSAVRGIIVLSPIFGTTWVFGVLSVNESLVIFQYLFAVFNCLQGFFVFLFYVVLCNQMKDGLRHMLRKYRSRSFDSNFLSTENQNSKNRSKNQQSGEFVSGAIDPSSDTEVVGFSDLTSDSKLASSRKPLHKNGESTKEPSKESKFVNPVTKGGGIGLMNPGFQEDSSNGERRLSLPGMNPVKLKPYRASLGRETSENDHSEPMQRLQGGSLKDLWY